MDLDKHVKYFYSILKVQNKIIWWLIAAAFIMMVICQYFNNVMHDNDFDRLFILLKWLYITILSAALILLVFEVFIMYRKNQCPKCRHAAAMKTVEVDPCNNDVGTADSISENSTGYTYTLHRKCRYCGYEDCVERVSTQKTEIRHKKR